MKIILISGPVRKNDLRRLFNHLGKDSGDIKSFEILSTSPRIILNRLSYYVGEKRPDAIVIDEESFFASRIEKCVLYIKQRIEKDSLQTKIFLLGSKYEISGVIQIKDAKEMLEHFPV